MTIGSHRVSGLVLCAFTGLGLEALLAFLIEPLFYGHSMNEWTVSENIIHWIITCIIWGLVTFALVHFAKRKYLFDIFSEHKKIKMWQWVAIIACVILKLIESYVDWEGFKIVIEFYANGMPKFIFQYIYYIFETALVMLIIIFSQKACEIWFKKANVPWGGIVVALTWGLAHIFTKGSLMVGLSSCLVGLLFGTVYLLTNRNAKIAFPILLIMFVF